MQVSDDRGTRGAHKERVKCPLRQMGLNPLGLEDVTRIRKLE